MTKKFRFVSVVHTRRKTWHTRRNACHTRQTSDTRQAPLCITVEKVWITCGKLCGKLCGYPHPHHPHPGTTPKLWITATFHNSYQHFFNKKRPEKDINLLTLHTNCLIVDNPPRALTVSKKIYPCPGITQRPQVDKEKRKFFDKYLSTYPHTYHHTHILFFFKE